MKLHSYNWIKPWTTVGKFVETVTGFYENLFNKYSEQDMTDAQKNKLYAEDKVADENREAEYALKEKWYNDYESPEAMVNQYKAAGLNPMMLAGGGASVSATSAPSTNAASAGSPASPDVLGLLMDSLFKKREMDMNAGFRERELDQHDEELRIQREVAEAGVNKSNAETEGINIQNKNLQDLLDLQKGELKEKINFLGQQIETEPVKRALLRAEVGVQKAREGLIKYQGAFAKAQAKYGDKYWSALVRGSELQNELLVTQNKFQSTLLLQELAINTKQLSLMTLDAIHKGYENKYYESDRKYNRVVGGISAGASALQAIGSVALGGAGLAASAGMKALGTATKFGAPPAAHVRHSQGIMGMEYDY